MHHIDLQIAMKFKNQNQLYFFTNNVQDMKTIFTLALLLNFNFFLTAQKILWFTDNPNVIHKADIDGTNQETYFLSGSGKLGGIDIDPINHKIYYTRQKQGSSNNLIGRCNFDGSEQEILIDDLEFKPHDIVVDFEEEKIYWSDEEEFVSVQINKANFDGSEIETIHTSSFSFQEVELELDIKNDKLYFWDVSQLHLARINLDGSDIEVIDEVEQCCDSFYGIDINPQSGKIYYTLFSEFGGSLSEVIKADLDGQNKEVILASTSFDLQNFFDITVDTLNQTVYLISNSWLLSTGLNGGDYSPLWSMSLSGLNPDGLVLIDEDPTSISEREPKPNKSISLSPNPTSGIINFHLDNIQNITLKKLRILNCQGQLIETYHDFSEKELQIAHLSNGVYFIEMSFENSENICERIILNK